jgi:hypothetical protein
VTVTVGGAVEGVRGKFAENKRTSGEDDGSAATKLSCAFGAVAPVAARAAGASSRDVVCVSPAARHGALAPLRVFAGAAVTAPPSPRARARGETDATFRVDAEGRAFATMRAGDAVSALVAGWGLTPRDACAYGAAALLSSAATSVSGLGRSDGALLVNPARSAHKASVQEQRKTFGIVECAAPRGAAGFAVVSATSSRAGFFFAGVAFQYAREDSPRVVLVAPAAALGGQGDVLHVSGANMHASGALEWRAYANENAHATAELYVRAENNAPLVVVSSAVAVLETPALAAPSSARATATPRGVAAGSAGAGSDERRDTSSMSFAVPVAVNREVAEVSPAAGSASGGTLVSLSPARDAPEGDARAEIDVLAAGGSACWFGAVGPVHGRRASDADSGSVACASPAGAPSGKRAGVSTRLAFGGAPNAEQNTLLGELTRAGGEAGTFSGDARARASSTFRRASDPAVPAALLSAAVVAPAGGDVSVWVPEWSEPYGGGTSASWLMRHDGETLGTTQTRVLRAFAVSRVFGLGDARAGRRRFSRARRVAVSDRRRARCVRARPARRRAGASIGGGPDGDAEHGRCARVPARTRPARRRGPRRVGVARARRVGGGRRAGLSGVGACPARWLFSRRRRCAPRARRRCAWRSGAVALRALAARLRRWL